MDETDNVLDILNKFCGGGIKNGVAPTHITLTRDEVQAILNHIYDLNRVISELNNRGGKDGYK